MDIMNDMIIDLIILLFLILLILFVTDFKLSSDKILNFWIKKGLESGIKEIEYPSSHRISIYFNDDIKIIDAWNANKYYGWMDSGILYVNGVKYEFHKAPSRFIKIKLDKAITKFSKSKYRLK